MQSILANLAWSSYNFHNYISLHKSVYTMDFCHFCHREIETGRDLRHRQRTIVFCRSVLNGEKKQICDVIEEHNFSPLNVVGLQLTKDTFDDSFRHRGKMCDVMPDGA